MLQAAQDKVVFHIVDFYIRFHLTEGFLSLKNKRFMISYSPESMRVPTLSPCLLCVGYCVESFTPYLTLQGKCRSYKGLTVIQSRQALAKVIS